VGEAGFGNASSQVGACPLKRVGQVMSASRSATMSMREPSLASGRAVRSEPSSSPIVTELRTDGLRKQPGEGFAMAS